MKNMDKQPGIKFDTVFLIKEQFERAHSIPETIKLDLKMNSNISGNDKRAFNELNTKLIGKAEDDTKVFEMNFTFVGVFSTIAGNENMGLDEFMNSNSAALMFPYIREYISTITTKAGMKPIFLSPINVHALINESEGKKD